MNKKITVTDLLSAIANTLDESFSSICVEGEIKGLTQSASKHWYFSITDPNSSLSCALFFMNAARNPIIKTLKDGDQVILTGSINLYKVRGNLQLIVSSVKKIGKGDFFEEFEKLKLKLKIEGLFDEAHKKIIPSYPTNIVIITSEKGAAISDFINVFKRRSQFMNLLLIPALVQGEEASASIRTAMQKVLLLADEKKMPVDVVVLMRGGGSIEDLWAFNDELLARDIYHFPLPIISAVGHQIDFTICDFVADKRAETPSAAAEILTENQVNLINRLNNLRDMLVRNMDNTSLFYKNKLAKCDPGATIGLIWERINAFKKRLERLDVIKNIWEITKVAEKIIFLDDLHARLSQSIDGCLMQKNNQISMLEAKLGSLDPKKVLERGYTMVTDSNQQVISSVKQFEKGDSSKPFDLHFADGSQKIFRKSDQ